MSPSQKCLELVQQFEGCSLTAYMDQRGIWTIGWGTTGLGIGPGVVWTQEQADQALMERLTGCGGAVAYHVRVLLSQDQFDAITSLVYHIGPGAFTGSTLVRLLNCGDYKDAGAEFLKWDHTNGVVNPGLLRRREAELALFTATDTTTD